MGNDCCPALMSDVPTQILIARISVDTHDRNFVFVLQVITFVITLVNIFSIPKPELQNSRPSIFSNP